MLKLFKFVEKSIIISLYCMKYRHIQGNSATRGYTPKIRDTFCEYYYATHRPYFVNMYCMHVYHMHYGYIYSGL